MSSRTLGLVLFVSLLFQSTLQAKDQQPSPENALNEYVRKTDDSYKWVKRREGKIGPTEYVELTLISQTWQGIVWKHQLFIIKPSTAPKETKHALFMIEGGRWRDELAEAPAAEERLPREAPLFALVAEQLGTPIAVLLQVPHQPILNGKMEDQIIAHTFKQFLETGDVEWPLLLPMVKSAVRGMDAVQEFALEKWGLKLESFTVTGASKRGWTTWLTGAVDPRAVAIAPMVIDTLNMVPQMKLQRENYGGDGSERIDDYTKLGLQKHLETKAGAALRTIVDPYSYRDQLKQPKLILLGTNDAYWPIGALNLYWDGLIGEKYILYVPNNGHGLKDYARIVGSLNALHEHSNGGPKLPKLSWNYEEQDGGVKLTVTSDSPPQSVRVWTAQSDSRDFRTAVWSSKELKRSGDVWEYTLPKPSQGQAAIFGEAVYDRKLPCYLSTTMQVLDAQSAE